MVMACSATPFPKPSGICMVVRSEMARKEEGLERVCTYNVEPELELGRVFA